MLTVTSVSLSATPIYEHGFPFNVIMSATSDDGQSVMFDLDYGDGTYDEADVGSSGSVTVSHSYGTDDSVGAEHHIIAHVTEISGGEYYPDPTLDETTQDAPLDASATQDLWEWQNVGFSETLAGFTDQDPQPLLPNEYDSTIDWGAGGRLDQGTVLAGDSPNDFLVVGGHTYPDPGVFNTGVQITDPDGAQTDTGQTIHVQSPALNMLRVADPKVEGAVAYATDGTVQHLYVAADANGQAQINIQSPAGGITPDEMGTRQAIKWQIQGDAASQTQGDFSQVANVLLTPTGSHEYQIAAESDANNDDVIEDSEKREVDVEVISADSIVANTNGQLQQAGDTSTTITKDNVIAVPQGVDLGLYANNVQPDDAKSTLKWEAIRNTADTLQGPPPTLTPQAGAPQFATLHADSPGSFNIIVYIDSNGSGSFDEGEQLRVLHLAIVKFTILENSYNVQTHDENFAVTGVGSGMLTETSGSGQANAAINATAKLLLEGGGADRTWGVDKIKIGWIQNVVQLGDVVSYGDPYLNPQLHSRTTVLASGVSYPVLDTGRTGGTAGTGGDTAFPWFNTPQYGVGQGQSGGQIDKVDFYDSPGGNFQESRIFADGTYHSTAVQGPTDFKLYVAAYSTDFDDSYSEFGEVDWEVFPSFYYNPSIFVPSSEWWHNNGSNTAGPTSIAALAPGQYAVTRGPDMSAAYQYVWN